MRKPKSYWENMGDLALKTRFNERRLELDPAFKRFHEETGRGLGDFLETFEGERLADKIGYASPRTRAIWVNRQRQDDPYLEIRLDLSRSKEDLRSEFEEILNKYHPRVQQSPTPRGKSKLDLDKIDFLCSIYKLVEKHNGSILKATWEYFPETQGNQVNEDTETEKRYTQIERWYELVKI